MNTREQLNNKIAKGDVNIFSQLTVKRYCKLYNKHFCPQCVSPVSSVGRAGDYESGGLEFDSRQVRQFILFFFACLF